MCGRPVLQWGTRDFRMDRRCDADSGISQSRHSRRIVPMTRSQIALAIGLCGGDFNTLTPGAKCLIIKVFCHSHCTQAPNRALQIIGCHRTLLDFSFKL
jgi:hypothetical protein